MRSPHAGLVSLDAHITEWNDIMTSYPHSLAIAPAWHDRSGEAYCTTCRRIGATGDCERHPEHPRVIVPPADIRPGDIIRYPFGVNNVPEIVTIHDTRAHDNGTLSIRYRFTSNPRGVDWRGCISRDAAGVELLSRGVARIDTDTRSLIPA